MTARQIELIHLYSDLHATTRYGERLSFAEWYARGLSLRAQMAAWKQDGEFLRETWGASWHEDSRDFAADEDEWAA